MLIFTLRSTSSRMGEAKNVGGSIVTARSHDSCLPPLRAYYRDYDIRGLSFFRSDPEGQGSFHSCSVTRRNSEQCREHDSIDEALKAIQ